MELIKFVCWFCVALATIITALAIYDNVSSDSIFKIKRYSDSNLDSYRRSFNNENFFYRLYIYLKRHA